jgi:phytoene synthase
VTSSTQPALGAIRLAWWREALERLDSKPPPPEPRLRAAAQEMLGRGISGAMLAELEDGWAALLDEAPDGERIARRGEKLFAIGGTLLGEEDPKLMQAGRLYALELAKRMQLAALPYPAEEMRLVTGHRFQRRLRPLTAFARLAARDVNQSPWVEPEATPGRAAALIAHRLSGLVTKAR